MASNELVGVVVWLWLWLRHPGNPVAAHILPPPHLRAAPQASQPPSAESSRGGSNAAEARGGGEGREGSGGRGGKGRREGGEGGEEGRGEERGEAERREGEEGKGDAVEGASATDSPPAPGRQAESRRGQWELWAGSIREPHRNRSEGEDGREYHKRVSREGRAG